MKMKNMFEYQKEIIEWKDKHKVLLEDWLILSKKCQKAYKENSILKKEKDYSKELKVILKPIREDINVLISAVNSLGDKLK